MITILSPAKKLSPECIAAGGAYTRPIFLDQSKDLVTILKSLDPVGLQSLMGISQNLSELNWERFQSWSSDFSPETSRQAAYSFKGDTYNGLDADTLSEKDMIFAQERVRILSGLYGVLKPLDLMLPYRLEMGTKLDNKRGKNLYEFWGDSISKTITQDLKNHKDKTVLNCASNEYFKSIDNSSLNANIVTPEFKEINNGKTRMISFYAKKARGMMSRFVIENRIEDTRSIIDFNMGGYKYDSSLSEELKPVFTRKQP